MQEERAVYKLYFLVVHTPYSQLLKAGNLSLVVQLIQVQSGSYAWSLVLSSWASLISSTAGDSSAWITVDHVYGLVARFLHTLNTKLKHWLGSPDVASVKHFWSLRVSSSWMLISFHFADTLLATSFIRSDNSGSLSSPLYLLPKPESEESQ